MYTKPCHSPSGRVPMNDNALQAALDRLYAAMLAHDLPALDALLTDDAIYVHSTGVVEGKAEFLAGVRDGLYEYERVVPLDQRILHAAGQAVVYTVLDFQGGPRGQPRSPVKLITTLVWLRQDAGWRMAIRHATRLS